MFDAVILSEPIDQMLEVAEWNEIQQLRENLLATIHGFASYAKKTDNDTEQKPVPILDRRNLKSRQNPRQHWNAAK